MFTFIAGALIAVQAAQNSRLKASIQPLPALSVNYVAGLLAVIAMMLFRPASWSGLAQARHASWWSWFGGLSGALYGFSVVLFANALGAATLTALAVSGQLICSVILDHYGWLGFDVHPAGVWRIAGCVLLVIGFVLIAKF